MATDSDLQTYKSRVVAEDNTNGGRLSDNVVTSGLLNNVWPNVTKAKRDAGDTAYRKLFDKFNTNDNAALSGAELLLDLPTSGDDWVVMFLGTPTDTQADIIGSERKYGVAFISEDVVAATQTIKVTVDDTSLTTGNDQIFQVGDKIRPTSKPNPSSGTGLSEDLTIATISVADPVITITTVEVIQNSYAVADNSRVSSIYEVPSNIQAQATSVTVTSAGGTYDDTGYPILMNNQGAIDATFTLLFSDANNFTVTCDDPAVTGLASGSITADYAPQNAAWSNMYFKLQYLGLGGTFATGDTIEITTKSASIQRWEKKVTPAGCAPLANNKIVSAWNGETA